ncbi:MAG: Gfo/Idh/MocA family oxidoreductase [Planctomycetaceae bacterium]
MPKQKYRVGIIGRTGKGGYGHGLDTVWQHVEQVEVVAVADDDQAGRAAALQRTGAKKSYADYREMLAQEKLDIVSICQRWIDQHHAMAMAAAGHGCHIYMEKPFCPTLQEADEIVQALEMRHLKLQIAHNNRHTPHLRPIRQLIRNGDIGDILEIRVRGKEDARRGGGEDLWVLGTHMLDLARMFSGDVISCFATVREGGEPVSGKHVRPGNEGLGLLAGDHIEAMFRFENGTPCFFASRRGAAGNPSRFGMAIYGSRGVIRMQSGYARAAWLLRDPAWSPGRSGAKWETISSSGVGKPETIAADSHHGGNLDAVNDLIRAIEEDRQPISSVYDARAVTEMIVAVFESQRVGGPVSLPLKNRSNPLAML